MKRSIAALLLAPALLLLPPACGGVSGDFADRCTLACKPPANTPCSTQDPTDCEKACVTATDGFTVACAQCVAEHSGWRGKTCTCSGSNCDESFFGPGDTTVGSGSGGGGTPACDPVKDTVCSGFKIQDVSTGTCKDECAVPAGK